LIFIHILYLRLVNFTLLRASSPYKRKAFLNNERLKMDRKINEKYRKKCCDDVTDFRELEHDRDKADSGCFAG
jgi:hypothetical protein